MCLFGIILFLWKCSRRSLWQKHFHNTGANRPTDMIEALSSEIVQTDTKPHQTLDFLRFWGILTRHLQIQGGMLWQESSNAKADQQDKRCMQRVRKGPFLLILQQTERTLIAIRAWRFNMTNSFSKIEFSLRKYNCFNYFFTLLMLK